MVTQFSPKSAPVRGELRNRSIDAIENPDSTPERPRGRPDCTRRDSERRQGAGRPTRAGLVAVFGGEPESKALSAPRTGAASSPSYSTISATSTTRRHDSSVSESVPSQGVTYVSGIDRHPSRRNGPFQSRTFRPLAPANRLSSTHAMFRLSERSRGRADGWEKRVRTRKATLNRRQFLKSSVVGSGRSRGTHQP